MSCEALQHQSLGVTSTKDGSEVQFNFRVPLFKPQQNNQHQDYKPGPGTCLMSLRSRTSKPQPTTNLTAAEDTELHQPEIAL